MKNKHHSDCGVLSQAFTVKTSKQLDWVNGWSHHSAAEAKTKTTLFVFINVLALPLLKFLFDWQTTYYILVFFNYVCSLCSVLRMRYTLYFWHGLKRGVRQTSKQSISKSCNHCRRTGNLCFVSMLFFLLDFLSPQTSRDLKHEVFKTSTRSLSLSTVSILHK